MHGRRLIFYMPDVMEERLLMQSPPSIVPEWYPLPYYAILRSITNRLLEVVGMLGSLFILPPMLGLIHPSPTRGSQLRPPYAIRMWSFVTDQSLKCTVP
jgi:ubiquinol-cytochrome c reductase cytochrome b subunit